MRQRLDQELTRRGLVTSRSQAESYIRLGKVTVNGQMRTKSGTFVSERDDIQLKTEEQYVSRAGLKLASVAEKLGVHFSGKTVLDVGSSTGGFTDYALRHGAKKVFAVDVGTNQLHRSLRGDERIELHEKTDIRNVYLRTLQIPSLKKAGPFTGGESASCVFIDGAVDIVVVDVSFISLRDILPHVARLMSRDSLLLAMVKPQFEAGRSQVSKGVIKNDRVRRTVLQDFEQWVKQYFIVADKADSAVAGAHGNRERFYMLRRVRL